MAFGLSEEQEAIREAARRIAAAEMAPRAAEWGENCVFPVETLRRAAGLGFAAMYCGAEHGGAGLARLDAALVFEELAAACPSTAAYISIHNMAAWMIDAFGNAAQRARDRPPAGRDARRRVRGAHDRRVPRRAAFHGRAGLSPARVDNRQRRRAERDDSDAPGGVARAGNVRARRLRTREMRRASIRPPRPSGQRRGRLPRPQGVSRSR